jgi:glucose/arabinose dehydrogenase
VLIPLPLDWLFDEKSFPEKYHNGAFILQHGSWNRLSISGYKVLFVPFKEGKPGDFLTGFISNQEKAEDFGTPCQDNRSIKR